MRDAVRAASTQRAAGDAVLLSPACASFDWYESYAARGDDFAREVRRWPTSRLRAGTEDRMTAFTSPLRVARRHARPRRPRHAASGDRDAVVDRDRCSCATVAVLNVVGVVMVLSASSVASLTDYGSPWYFFFRQLMWTRARPRRVRVRGPLRLPAVARRSCVRC